MPRVAPRTVRHQDDIDSLIEAVSAYTRTVVGAIQDGRVTPAEGTAILHRARSVEDSLIAVERGGDAIGRAIEMARTLLHCGEITDHVDRQLREIAADRRRIEMTPEPLALAG